MSTPTLRSGPPPYVETMATANPGAAARQGARGRWVLPAFLLLLGGTLALLPGIMAGQGGRSAVVLQVQGVIGPASADYIIRGRDKAEDRNAALVVLQLDTPGGLDSSMRDIIRAILAAKIPVATYVHPGGARAASAGTYILYASHVAAMSPGTNLGAATPVQLGGGRLPFGGEEEEKKDKPDRKAEDGDRADRPPQPATAMERKVVNDATAYIRGLAELRGRNADWAEKAVREGVSLSAKDAQAQNVVDIVAAGLDDLLAQMDGRTVKVGQTDATIDSKDLAIVRIEPDWRTELLAAITNPNVALILMMIGIYGLIFEFMNPGALYPGTIGAICLLTGLYALAALPVSYAGMGLIALGIGLMTAEAFAPSFGILGIGGAIAFILGAMILIDTDLPAFEISWPVIGGVVAVSLGFSLIVLRLAWRAQRRKVVTGIEQMIGAPGRVLQWSGGKGHVAEHGERWAAVGPDDLEPGSGIRVMRLEGLTLTVAPDTQADNEGRNA